jgi:hypothetical protein
MPGISHCPPQRSTAYRKLTRRLSARELPILFQVFERRVLTYNPANPPRWRMEMGNVGRHSYKWRYGTETERDRADLA